MSYPACSQTRQSPINIEHDVAVTDNRLPLFRFHGYDSDETLNNLTVWNDGYTGKNDAITSIIKAQTYTDKSFHCPSSPSIFVAFVEDNGTMSSIRYFENHVSYFVQNQTHFSTTDKWFSSTQIYN